MNFLKEKELIRLASVNNSFTSHGMWLRSQKSPHFQKIENDTQPLVYLPLLRLLQLLGNMKVYCKYCAANLHIFCYLLFKDLKEVSYETILRSASLHTYVQLSDIMQSSADLINHRHEKLLVETAASGCLPTNLV